MSLKLVQRPKSPYWIIRGTVNERRIEETCGTTDKKTAEAIRIKREAELLTESIFGKKATITFTHAALSYLEYGDGEKRFLKPLVDHFGATLLHKIGQDEIEHAAKKLLPKASPATRNRQVYTPMSAILHHAAGKGWCPVPFIARPKQPAGKVRWITLEEADKLIDSSSRHLRPLIVFLLYTGARAGEAVWLDWSNINLKLKQVTFPDTKNGEPRSVPLHPRVIQELTALQHRQGPVFLTHKGKPYERPKPDDDNDQSAGTRIKSAFTTACRRAGIVKFTPHCCRHTFATWHYQANRDLTALQKLGGWKSVAMVMRYAHTNVTEHAASIENLPGGDLGEWDIKKEKNVA